MITEERHTGKNLDELWLVYFRHKSASANICILQDEGTMAYLYDLFSWERGLGHATELLHEIDSYCKREKITLIIEAEPFKEGAQKPSHSSDELLAWYEARGAELVSYNSLTGAPQLFMGFRG